MEATGSTKKQKKESTIMSTTTTTTTATTNGGREEEEEGGDLDLDLDLDLISKLPDSLLHHILSYLDDMTTVVQTCFLSRRWRYVWSSLPCLNFDSGFHSSSVALPFFITRALVFRNQNSNIHTFRVSHEGDLVEDFFIGNISTHILTWIRILTQICCTNNTNNTNNNSLLQVFDLHLLILTDFIIKLPTCFQSLTTLKLHLGDDEVAFSRPSCFKLSAADGTTSGLYLPALKTLHLKSMCFENWVDVEMLIAGTPILQNLVFSNCFYQIRSPRQELNVCHAQLQSLVIQKMYSCDETLVRSFYHCYIYESCRFNVFAPKLVSFISRDHFDLINDYFFGNVSSLDNAEIYTVLDPVLAVSEHQDNDLRAAGKDPECDLRALKKKVYIANVIDCLRGIYNVRSLKISAWLLELVTEVPGGLESLPMAPFYNLRILKLKTTSSKYQIHAGMYLLEKCPSLETLILKMTMVNSVSVEEEECWEAELAPQCIMHHLKLVEIREALASANELEYLKFLLKNAITLEKLKVLSSKKQPPNNRDLEIFGVKLKSFCGAASSRTEILFQSSTHLQIQWILYIHFSGKKKDRCWETETTDLAPQSLPQTCRDLITIRTWMHAVLASTQCLGYIEIDFDHASA